MMSACALSRSLQPQHWRSAVAMLGQLSRTAIADDKDSQVKELVILQAGVRTIWHKEQKHGRKANGR